LTKRQGVACKRSENPTEHAQRSSKRRKNEHGHERTTVREIAAKASVDPALVIRYFGSKDELFVRAAAFDLKVPDLDKIKRSQIGETLIRRFLELGEGFTGMTVLLRSAASNEYAASRIRKLLAAQVVPAFARVGNRATARERAALVTSQLLGLALCRYILKISPLAEMSQEVIVKHIAPTVQRYASGTSSKRSLANKPLKKPA
jgi:AcrR family transcriptional regulator